MPTNLYELVWTPSKGRDVAQPIPIPFDPEKYKTAKGAAQAMHAAMVKQFEPVGFPASGIHLWTPEQAKASMANCELWTICWEDGFYDWAVTCSCNISGPWGYCEPYNGFILHFVGD